MNRKIRLLSWPRLRRQLISLCSGGRMLSVKLNSEKDERGFDMAKISPILVNEV